MSETLLKISGGYVYDPANDLDGQVKDLWVRDGKMIEPPTDPSVKPTRHLNATGLIVMPGGVDMHCHIAGPKVNVARKMRPEEKRRDAPVRRTATTHSGTMGVCPARSQLATSMQDLGTRQRSMLQFLHFQHAMRMRNSKILRVSTKVSMS